ncbi:MAG: hypothetical protein ACRC0L_01340 [Angustibacter sp.]
MRNYDMLAIAEAAAAALTDEELANDEVADAAILRAMARAGR